MDPAKHSHDTQQECNITQKCTILYCIVLYCTAKAKRKKTSQELNLTKEKVSAVASVYLLMAALSFEHTACVEKDK